MNYRHGRIVQPTTKAFMALFVQKRSRVIEPSINMVRSPRNTTIPAVATHRSLVSSTSLRRMALAFRLLTAVAAQTNAEKPSICCKISIQYICTHVIHTMKIFASPTLGDLLTETFAKAIFAFDLLTFHSQPMHNVPNNSISPLHPKWKQVLYSIV